MHMDLQRRAELSGGISSRPIYDMVARAVDRIGGAGGNGAGFTVVDCGCGRGELHPYIAHRCARYIGLDVIRHEGLPPDTEFGLLDAASGAIPLPEETADLALAVETIEHVENPRAFLRELLRTVKRGGWLLVTTPNQLSLLSLASLLVHGRFAAFSDRDYPAHITALLEIDLRRMAAELGLHEVVVEFSLSGRIPLTGRHYPGSLSARLPRRLSDNLILVGRKS